MSLTESQSRGAKPKATTYRLTDGGGLVLSITPAGTKTWRFRYLRDGKDAVITLGYYPAMSLLDARAEALRLKSAQRSGTAPGLIAAREAEVKRQKLDGTFGDVARACPRICGIVRPCRDRSVVGKPVVEMPRLDPAVA